MKRIERLLETKKVLSFLIVLLCGTTSIFAQKEADFYIDKSKEVSKKVDLVEDYGTNNTDTNDDTPKLQKAINDMTSLKKGGEIFIPKGTYYFKNIELKSNVHLVIDEHATIIPTPTNDTKNYKVFLFGGKKGTIKNVSIRSTKNFFTVDLQNVINKSVAVITLSNVENFLISGIKVLDDNTRFSAITLGYAEYKNQYFKPTNGVIKNCTITKAHYGYGLIQSQASEHVYYKNLSGEGGVTLRLETGYKKMNKLKVGGNFDVYAKNLSSKNANATLMISPHTITNGYFEVDGVTAINSGFAVRIGKGYTTKDQKKAGLTPGTYDSTSKISNVTATYGKTAQVKSKHFKYMPCKERTLIASSFNPDGESYTAPSISPIVNAAKGSGAGYFNVEITNVSGTGFSNLDKDILIESDAIKTCPDGKKMK
ncbi:hypothetical protein EI427_02780 [Flammeovirga pectinis]|uniref:Rhamnogalacturonase A/B/Epimerase-like pectate lyase domain-containing protein n=1 Tax=Flammeovirga pectinis TaxID=2494373 RepID=A0A3Q9FJP5_9BACT|nr:glycosyl hydrolase family 28-related protein [Flammeovirga pectinis]AZQ61181.1 hypothetical protein EI427_02780 [Flammeovirga pectinis]